MTAEEKYSDNQINIRRRGGHDRHINDKFESKVEQNHEEQKNIEENNGDMNSPGMVFSNRNGPAGIGKMSEYAQTGIYIDPN